MHNPDDPVRWANFAPHEYRLNRLEGLVKALCERAEGDLAGVEIARLTLHNEQLKAEVARLRAQLKLVLGKAEEDAD